MHLRCHELRAETDSIGVFRILIFQDPDGSYVAVEILGTWAVREKLARSVSPHHLVKFSFSKKLGANF